jgi:hypothetical protein
VPAEGQVRRDPGLFHLEVQLGQAGGVRGGERVVDQVGQGLTPPQARRLLQRGDRGDRVAVVERAPGLGEQPPGAFGVDLLGLDLERVAGPPADQDRGLAGHVQPPPQVADVGPQRGQRLVRDGHPPDRLLQGVDRHHPARLQQQRRQQHLPLGAAERDGLAPHAHLERAEDGELQSI